MEINRNKNRDKAALLLLLAIASQWLHRLFIGVVHSEYIREDNGEVYQVYLSDMVYYLVDELATFIFVVITCIHLWQSLASKVLLSGLFGWYLVEVVEIILKFFNIIDIRTSVNSVSVWQISTSLVLMILVYTFGRK